MVDTRAAAAAGMVAGAVMGAVVMVVEAARGTGFWSPLILIAAAVIDELKGVRTPVPFHPVGVAVGVAVHLVNSVVLGLIFVRIFGRSGRVGASLVRAGLVYGLMVFAIMWYVVLPTMNPVMLQLNAVLFGGAHLVWGGVLGARIGKES